MPSFACERQFIDYVIEQLMKNNGYIKCESVQYNKELGIDTSVLKEFLDKTQKDTLFDIQKLLDSSYKATNAFDTILQTINQEILKEGGSLIEVLNEGVFVEGKHVTLLYKKPDNSFNEESIKKYDENIFSVVSELESTQKNSYDKREAIDMVVFINGFAIATYEFKFEHSGQTYKNAEQQYKDYRDPNVRLFTPYKGALVHFAMDTSNISMTTALKKKDTKFLPFNQGRGSGINMGAGNPIYEDKLSVHYMWDEILTKDSLVEIINDFIKIEKNEDGSFKNLIFPRYHQLNVVRKIIDDIKHNKGRKKNYLIQHSAGSGKTNTIAWLANKLSSLYVKDENNKEDYAYDQVVIVTDRIIVDRQNQKVISNFKHKSATVEVLGNGKSSKDLLKHLNTNSNIIITTIQKFLYTRDELSDLKNKRFAVIIDEAHSSTAGKDMIALNSTLNSSNNDDIEDLFISKINSMRQKDNSSFFAFTATPKSKTLSQFGVDDGKGQKVAFHTYSMKQAIEEKFILNVLANYQTYKTSYNLEAKYGYEQETGDGARIKRDVAKVISCNDEYINLRLKEILEHFFKNVVNLLEGNAKAMIVTASREECVLFFFALQDYIKKENLDINKFNALVAFSGEVSIGDKKYTEKGLNEIPESEVPRKFNESNYKFLIVANKYQTGFSQSKLCAMYVCKKLSGINTVQTLSRLNRPYKNKKTFVLDFVNNYDDIKKDFETYYTTTILDGVIDMSKLKELGELIDSYRAYTTLDLEEISLDILTNKTQSSNYQQRLDKIVDKFITLPKEESECANIVVNRYVKTYEFYINKLEQNQHYVDDISKMLSKLDYQRYVVLNELYVSLASKVSDNKDDVNVIENMKDKITVSDFKIKIQDDIKEPTNIPLTSSPAMKENSVSMSMHTKEMKEKSLGDVINEINALIKSQFPNCDVENNLNKFRSTLANNEEVLGMIKANPKETVEEQLNDENLINNYISSDSDIDMNLLGDIYSREDLRKKLISAIVNSLYKDISKNKTN